MLLSIELLIEMIPGASPRDLEARWLIFGDGLPQSFFRTLSSSFQGYLRAPSEIRQTSFRAHSKYPQSSPKASSEIHHNSTRASSGFLQAPRSPRAPSDFFRARSQRAQRCLSHQSSPRAPPELPHNSIRIWMLLGLVNKM